MSSKAIDVTLRGISPLLMHAYPMVPIIAMEKKSPSEQAELAAYRDPDTGGLYIPGRAVQRGLVSAASYSKGKGRSTLVRQTAASVIVSPERLLLGTDKYEIDSQPVVVPATKGRILRHRPRLDKWQVSFTLEYDNTLMDERQVRQIVDDLGSRVGLLDFRPEKKGPFGRFMVVQWEAHSKRHCREAEGEIDK